MNIKYAISFCLVGVLGSTVSAQEGGMKSLDSILSTDFEISYIPMRCGGLYMSMASYAGEASVGAEQYINMLMGADRLIRIAAEIRTEKNSQSEQENYENAVAEAALIAQMYLDRFQMNYLNNGSAWMSDSSFLEDLEICTELNGESDG